MSFPQLGYPQYLSASQAVYGGSDRPGVLAAAAAAAAAAASGWLRKAAAVALAAALGRPSRAGRQPSGAAGGCPVALQPGWLQRRARGAGGSPGLFFPPASVAGPRGPRAAGQSRAALWSARRFGPRVPGLGPLDRCYCPRAWRGGSCAARRRLLVTGGEQAPRPSPSLAARPKEKRPSP